MIDNVYILLGFFLKSLLECLKGMIIFISIAGTNNWVGDDISKKIYILVTVVVGWLLLEKDSFVNVWYWSWFDVRACRRWDFLFHFSCLLVKKFWQTSSPVSRTLSRVFLESDPSAASHQEPTVSRARRRRKTLFLRPVWWGRWASTAGRLQQKKPRQSRRTRQMIRLSTWRSLNAIVWMDEPARESR